MIDFKNAKYFKLRRAQKSEFLDKISSFLMEDENIIETYKTIRDGIVFTDKRIIIINIQGITGKKKSFTSISYSKIQVFSVETAGVFDLESELYIWISPAGEMKFEFLTSGDILTVCKCISKYSSWDRT